MSKIYPSIELPLYAFFEKLQTYDAQLEHQVLGHDVYMQLVEALGAGYGLLDAEELYGLCKRIWLKPYHEEQEFRNLFDLHLARKLKMIAQEETAKEAVELDTSDDKEVIETSPTIQEPTEITTEEEETMDEVEDKINTTSKIEKRKTVALNFKSATTSQNEFLETDIATIEQDIHSKIYRLRGQYPSLSPRKVEQVLRSLRLEADNYRQKQLDLPATINWVANHGYLEKIIYSYASTSTTPVRLLIDEGGSMVAFFQLVEMLSAKVEVVNKEENAVYYFRNCPVKKVYLNKEQTKGIPIDTFIQRKTPLLIVSDAGAARGRYDKERIQATEQFLKQLKNIPTVWVNPFPKHRWLNTSADYISALVPMYEATDAAFINAVKRFK